jgi:predicted TIM-barrel fold metal-dependent hydrolase
MNANQPLIDADVHNAVANSNELLPFLSDYWKNVVRRSGMGVSRSLYPSPIGVLREDARPPGGGTPGSDPQFLIKDHLDRYGIDYAILTGSDVLGLSLHPDPDFGNAIASAYNDLLIHKWLEADPRFKGSLIINHSDPIAAAKEIDRVGDHPDVVQVLMASGARTPFGQRVYHPIYEAAARHGLPVAIHPGTEGAGIANAPTSAGYPTRYFEWHNILPANYMAHINSLVCEGVFEKFPTLTFVAIEGGVAWLPHLMWRMDKNYKALRATTPWLKRLPSEYIKAHIRLTTQPIEEPQNREHLTQIFQMIEAEKMVMFSSDYPHWDFDNPNRALPPLPEPMQQRIFFQNAAELYQLAVPSANERPAHAKSASGL